MSAAQDAVTSAARKISGSTIKDRSVTASKLARGTLTGTQIKNGSLGEAEFSTAVRARLATTGATGPAGPKGDPGPAVVPANGVETANVRDGTLTGADIGCFATTLNDLDFGLVNSDTCKTVSSTSLSPVTTAGQDLRDDALVVTPAVGFPQNALAVYAQPVGANQVAVTVCNATNGTVNVGAQDFRLVSIEVG